MPQVCLQETSILPTLASSVRPTVIVPWLIVLRCGVHRSNGCMFDSSLLGCAARATGVLSLNHSPVPLYPVMQATEDFMVHLFEDCNLCAIHAKRVTISKWLYIFLITFTLGLIHVFRFCSNGFW
jgi:hypothetical protein